MLDQRADIHGNVMVHARPAIAADWRLLPNLTSQVTLADSTVMLAGFKIDVAGEAKPLIEREVNAQIARLETRLRNDPMLERAAREQWAKLCRSIALGGGETGLPRLWLEMKPIRAAAAQPQIDAQNMTLTIGVQAETRITERESKPNCPFPAALELVPPMQNGKLSVGLPIDVPFAALNKVLTAQLKGRIFPENADAAVRAEVRGVALAAAGERLLITLKVKAREQKSWFGFGADATIHVWGKPVLDDKNQILRLSEIALAVDTEAGLLSAAARAALPYLQQALADQARGGLEAVRGRRAQEDHVDARRIPPAGARHPRRRRDRRAAADRHRLRCAHAAHHRRSGRLGEGGGERTAEDVREAVVPAHAGTHRPQPIEKARRMGPGSRASRLAGTTAAKTASCRAVWRPCRRRPLRWRA